MELLTTNNVWMIVCAALVFFMHLGFSFLEIGLTRQKNTINISFTDIKFKKSKYNKYCLLKTIMITNKIYTTNYKTNYDNNRK